MAVGGHRTSDEQVVGSAVDVSAVECSIADLLGLVHEMADELSTRDYEIRIGIEWNGPRSMTFFTRGAFGINEKASVARFTPIRASIATNLPFEDYANRVYDIATDAVNQAGVREPTITSKSVIK